MLTSRGPLMGTWAWTAGASTIPDSLTLTPEATAIGYVTWPYGGTGGGAPVAAAFPNRAPGSALGHWFVALNFDNSEGQTLFVSWGDESLESIGVFDGVASNGLIIDDTAGGPTRLGERVSMDAYRVTLQHDPQGVVRCALYLATLVAAEAAAVPSLGRTAAAALILARAGDPAAPAAAVTLWTAIADRVPVQYAGAALDSVAAHVGAAVGVPDSVIREAIVRAALYLRNTEPVVGFSSYEASGTNVAISSEYHGAALRRSGSLGLLAPWIQRRARLVE